MYPIKEEDFLPEYKGFVEDFKERISNRFKEYFRWIKNKMMKDIVNYYYSIENDTCFCDKAILFQS